MFNLKLEGRSGESMVTNIVLVAMGGIVLLALSLVLMTSDGCSEGVGSRLPLPEAAFNYQQRTEDPWLDPGYVSIKAEGDDGFGMEMTLSPEEVREARQSKNANMPLPVNPGDDASNAERSTFMRQELIWRGETLTPLAESEIDLAGKLQHDPIVKIQPEVKVDVWGTTDPDLDLKREFVGASRRPLQAPYKSDEKNGPYYEPIQQEESWFAFENLVAEMLTLNASSLKEASNGQQVLDVKTPEVIKDYRGRVFDSQGVLWSLRKQPLRTGAFEYQGKTYEHAYYGVIAFLRRGELAGEKDWVHSCISFTTLTLPKELEEYALEPGEMTGNDDALAKGEVFVKLSGVFFRRIVYYEPVATIETRDTTKTEGTLEREFWAETYLPWLVTPSIELAQANWPPEAEAREIVNAHAENKYSPETRDKFDEPGYYLLMRSLSDSNLKYAELPEEEINYRRLLTASERARYRGAKIAVGGFLQADYQPVILPPNISGKRHVFRCFVLDAVKSTEIDNAQQWYVDVIEPPSAMRGLASVSVQGHYYRSQQWSVKSEDGKLTTSTYPLLIAQKINAREVEVSPEERTMNMLALWITLGVGSVVVVGLIFMGRRDRKRRDEFEMETMSLVRSQMRKSRAQASQVKAKSKAKSKAADASQSGGETDSPSADASSDQSVDAGEDKGEDAQA